MNKKKIGIGLLVLVVIVVAYSMFDKKSNTTEMPLTTSTTTPLGIGVTTSGDGQYVIEQVPLDEGRTPLPPAPNIDRATVFSATISADVKKVLEEKIAELKSVLKKDPTLFASWIELGTYHKIAGDFEGAKIYWQYAGVLGPNNFVSFANLGDLYAYYLKDVAMAERMYLKAIENAPRQTSLYISLATVYKDVSKDMDKAKKIIERGLSVAPQDKSLLEFQKTLQ